jgi:hypothetical protein
MIINVLLAAIASLEPVPAASTPVVADPVKLWISSDRTFRPGDAVRVQVETDRSGYLLVLHVEPSGRLSVLFPISPDDDALVEAGRRYEIRDERGNNSFIAAGPGQGIIYSALADDPWAFSSVRVATGWDYGRLSIDKDSRDPEADITALLEPLTTERGYDYDILDYTVYGRGYAGPATYIYDDGWGCYSCGYYSPSIVYVGLGWPYGFGYWPWHYHYRYYNYYGFGRYGRPWYWGYPYYPYHRNYPVFVPVHRGPRREVIGRSRGYTVEPRSRGGSSGVRGDARDGSGGRERPSRARRPRGGEGRDGSVAPPSNGSTGTRSGSSDAGRSTERSRGESNGRARGGRPSSERLSAERPNMERSRPESRTRGSGWIRDGDAPEAARVPARRSESAPPVYIERSATRARGGEPRGEVQEVRNGVARRLETSPPVYMERSRGSSERSRAVSMPEIRRSQPESRRSESVSRPARESPRSEARPRDGGSRSMGVSRPSSPRPARVESRGGGGSRAVSQPRGSSGSRASNGSRGGGGGGRSRGGRP